VSTDRWIIDFEQKLTKWQLFKKKMEFLV